MLVLQFALLMFSLSLLTAAFLAPPKAWITPLGASSISHITSDNEARDDECKVL